MKCDIVKCMPNLIFQFQFQNFNFNFNFNFKLSNYQEHHETRLLGEFYEISMSQSEDITWNTRKYRGISEILTRFVILTKFLSIEFLQT